MGDRVRRRANAFAFLADPCEVCGDLLFAEAYTEKDGLLFCNERCRAQLHRMKRRVLWETHAPTCMCQECCG